MYRALVFVVILFSVQIALVFGESEYQELDSHIDLITVKNATEYFREKSIKNYVRLEKTNLNRASIRYTLGNRVSGEHLVKELAKDWNW